MTKKTKGKLITMKKAIILLILVIFLSACTVKSDGGSPVDGKWDNVIVYNGSEIIFEGTKVTIKTNEYRSTRWASDNTSWVQYELIVNGKSKFILDCESLTIVYWNEE